MREIYFLVIFIIVYAILSPSFADFSYYFLLDVIHISKFMFALLKLIGNICSLIGALFYKSFFRNIDTRTMTLIGLIVNSVSLFLTYCFAKRWNQDIGISDLAFLLFTDVVFEIITEIFLVLPIMVLFAKITPRRIEGTIYAFLTGTMDFCQQVISPSMGTFINYEFVGVNKNDLSGYPTLCLIAFIMSLFAFALLPLIPTKLQVRGYRRLRRKEYEVVRMKRRERRQEKKRIRE